jgi:hypothetical protein
MALSIVDKAKAALSVQKLRDVRRNILSQFCCIACKETDADLIDWHHVNPEDKEFSIGGSSLTVQHDRWWLEVLKCVPLCALCHRKLHMNKLCLLPIHR